MNKAKRDGELAAGKSASNDGFGGLEAGVEAGLACGWAGIGGLDHLERPNYSQLRRNKRIFGAQLERLTAGGPLLWVQRPGFSYRGRNTLQQAGRQVVGTWAALLRAIGTFCLRVNRCGTEGFGVSEGALPLRKKKRREGKGTCGRQVGRSTDKVVCGGLSGDPRRRRGPSCCRLTSGDSQLSLQ